jgi:hypothetical protein
VIPRSGENVLPDSDCIFTVLVTPELLGSSAFNYIGEKDENLYL